MTSHDLDELQSHLQKMVKTEEIGEVYVDFLKATSNDLQKKLKGPQVNQITDDITYILVKSVLCTLADCLQKLKKVEANFGEKERQKWEAEDEEEGEEANKKEEMVKKLRSMIDLYTPPKDRQLRCQQYLHKWNEKSHEVFCSDKKWLSQTGYLHHQKVTSKTLISLTLLPW